MMNKGSIIKISAAGNKFLLADKRWFLKNPDDFLMPYGFSTSIPFENFSELDKKTQEERFLFFQKILSLKESRGTDGFIILKDPTTNSNPHYDFYNKDGSSAEMCGNASCCLAVYAWRTGLPFQSFQLSQMQVKTVQDSEGDFSIALEIKPQVKAESSFSFDNQDHPYFYCEAGVPHAVLEWDSDLNKEKLKPLAQELRQKNTLSERGMNISFYQIKKDNHLKGMTFERGVEDFSLACGTGALAIATVFRHQYPDKKFKQIVVSMPGGDLVVQMTSPPLLKSPVIWGYSN